MSIVPIEKKEEYKAVIRRVLTMNPSISTRELQRRLSEANEPITLSRDYLTELVGEVRIDRIREVEEETKEDIYAKMADVVEYVNQQLRAIAQEEKLVYSSHKKDGVPSEKPETRIFAQNNRIKAMNSIIDNLIKLYNLKMDLGIIERKVGTMDHKIIDTMSALKKIRNGDYTTPIEQLIPTLIEPDTTGEGEEDRA